MLKSSMLAGTALAAMLAIASPVTAARGDNATPQPINFGQTVHGSVSAPGTDGSQCTPEGPGARRYSFHAEAGTRIDVRLTADDFDTMVEIGRMDGCNFVSLGSNDDGGGEDGLNSHLIGRIPTTGDYIIRATSFDGESAGDFELTLTRLPALREPDAPVALSLDQKVEGRFTGDEATMPDNAGLGGLFSAVAASAEETSIVESGRPYRLYSLSGEAGQSFLIKLDSDEFDSYLEVGVDSPLGFSVAASNDDGPGDNDGLNSRLIVTFAHAGTLLVRVSPYSNATGAYTLHVVNPPSAEEEAAEAADAAAPADEPAK